MPDNTGPFSEVGGVAPEVTMSTFSSYDGLSSAAAKLAKLSSNFLIARVKLSSSLIAKFPTPVPC